MCGKYGDLTCTDLNNLNASKNITLRCSRYILHLGYLHIATGGHRNCGHQGNRREDQSAAGLQYSNAGSVRVLPSRIGGIRAFQRNAQRAASRNVTYAVRRGFRLKYRVLCYHNTGLMFFPSMHI